MEQGFGEIRQEFLELLKGAIEDLLGAERYRGMAKLPRQRAYRQGYTARKR